jgi:hypothetical protein
MLAKNQCLLACQSLPLIYSVLLITINLLYVMLIYYEKWRPWQDIVLDDTSSFKEIFMSRNHIFSQSLGLYFFLVSAMSSAYAIERGTTKTGISFVSGGVDQSELMLLNEEKKKFSFWLTTATKGSGAYLATVRVRIINASTRQSVLEHTMDGPWLFATLPLGRFDVEASYTEAIGQPVQVVKKSTTIHQGDHHQMMMYFDTKDTVGKDGESLFNDSPYNNK